MGDYSLMHARCSYRFAIGSVSFILSFLLCGRTTVQVTPDMPRQEYEASSFHLWGCAAVLARGRPDFLCTKVCSFPLQLTEKNISIGVVAYLHAVNSEAKFA